MLDRTGAIKFFDQATTAPSASASKLAADGDRLLAAGTFTQPFRASTLSALDAERLDAQTSAQRYCDRLSEGSDQRVSDQSACFIA